MALEDAIAEQLKRIGTLRKEFIDKGATPETAKQVQNLREERVALLTGSIRRLRRDREAAIARFDTEIAARERELKELQRPTDLDLVRRSGGGGEPAKGGKA
ncbi:hypothetical protein JF540_23105 [Salipiger thiooxidans]|uniref:hypothetical protein n=1 Tax=Salipiger thiooxidans TaxID=282683 RepID=UPI001A8F469E|nr:hypothetical protein [Salipiger thiooxidans]MBN8189579.1 hypothetical protein [Salipiger thiooxidans]